MCPHSESGGTATSHHYKWACLHLATRDGGRPTDGQGNRAPAASRRTAEAPAPSTRNFPTREILIEAAWRNELSRLCDAAPGLLDAGVRAGTIRSDIGATDMLAGLTGIALASGEPEQREQAERLLDLTLDGLSTDRH